MYNHDTCCAKFLEDFLFFLLKFSTQQRATKVSASMCLLTSPDVRIFCSPESVLYSWCCSSNNRDLKIYVWPDHGSTTEVVFLDPDSKVKIRNIQSSCWDSNTITIKDILNYAPGSTDPKTNGPYTPYKAYVNLLDSLDSLRSRAFSQHGRPRHLDFSFYHVLK